jgi:hypothetical protein
MSKTPNDLAGSSRTEAQWLDIVRLQIASLRFGVVEIVIHDSRVTQIGITDRLRLDEPARKNRPEQEA